MLILYIFMTFKSRNIMTFIIVDYTFCAMFNCFFKNHRSIEKNPQFQMHYMPTHIFYHLTYSPKCFCTKTADLRKTTVMC